MCITSIDAAIGSIRALMKAGDQCVTLELGDIVGGPGIATCLDIRRVSAR